MSHRVLCDDPHRLVKGPANQALDSRSLGLLAKGIVL